MEPMILLVGQVQPIMDILRDELVLGVVFNYIGYAEYI